MKLKTLFLPQLLLLMFINVLAIQYGYHSLVGIPVAKRIYSSETTSAPGQEYVNYTGLADHNYLIGVVVTVDASYSVCGASLLTNTRALTAAHCWWDGWRRAWEFTLVFGSEYIFVGGTRIKTKNVVTHHQWNPFTMINNLAMIKFDRVEYSKYVQPIVLPVGLERFYLVGLTVQASGYGRIANDSQVYFPELKQTRLSMKIVPTERCLDSTVYFMQRTLCTQSFQEICISHSGGPLVAEYYKRQYLIGVASFGDYNCLQHQPTLTGYVRVTSYIEWIFSKLNQM